MKSIVNFEAFVVNGNFQVALVYILEENLLGVKINISYIIGEKAFVYIGSGSGITWITYEIYGNFSGNVEGGKEKSFWEIIPL